MIAKRLLIGLVLTVMIGCGGGNSPTEINTTEFTEEQKKAIKQADKEVNDEEKSGAGSATPPKKKRR